MKCYDTLRGGNESLIDKVNFDTGISFFKIHLPEWVVCVCVCIKCGSSEYALTGKASFTGQHSFYKIN